MIVTVTLNAAIDKRYVIDSLKPYEVMRVKEVSATAGGKGLNVARVADIAGEKVKTMGFIGGYNGQYFKSLITEPNIVPDFTMTNGETRTCINVHDDATNSSTEFLEPGAPVSEGDITSFLAQYENGIQDADVIAISGSMPKGLPEDFYNTLIDIAKKQSKKVILDSSGASLKHALGAKPYMVKPNTDEIRQIMNVDINSEEDVVNAASKLHEGGIPIVAVSLGKDGVIVVSDEGAFHAAPPRITAVNTVGCGDSMVAGFSVGLARGNSIEDVIRFAVAVSAANALTDKTGSYDKKDFFELYPKVTIKKLR